MAYTLDEVRGMTIADVMRREVLAADADWSLETLADFLIDNSISGAPVTTDDDELVGVVSLTDIVRQGQVHENSTPAGPHDVYLYELELESHIGREELRVFHTREDSPVRVRDIMTPMIFSVTRDTRLQEVADTMLKGGIHRVFITDGTRLTGIATTLDLMQVLRDI
jgi:CBS domain-containing protein